MVRRYSELLARAGLAVGLVLCCFARLGGAQQPQDSAIRQGPKILVPGDHGVGRYVPEVSFTDVTGKTGKLSDFSRNKAVVVAMTSTSCPLSKKYLPTLLELATSNRSREVALLLVNPVAADSPSEMKAIAAALDSNAVYIWDKDATLAKAVGAATTTDAFLLDPSRTVVYHGAIDDQYGFGYSLNAPRSRYLAEALESLLAGRVPAIAATEAPGCTLDLDQATAPTASVTYHNRISRIVQRSCVECHRDGGVAPFSLETLDDVTAHAPMIRQVVERGIMPPWFAAPPENGRPSPWSNDSSLADAEKQDLLAWIDGGQTPGDSRDAPQPRAFPDGWLIGKPDTVFEMPRAISVKAGGVMPYQYVAVETDLGEDKWVQALEVRPGARDVVHHVLVFDMLPGQEDRFRGGTNGFFAAYVPGSGTIVYPEGYARRLRKGSRLVFQLHYTPSGKATEDRSQLGLVFAKTAPRHEVHVMGLANTKLQIPPQAENYADDAQIRVPADVQLLALMPHMHLRGKACRYETISADGRTTTLLDVPRYDFNWQLPYRFAEPPTIRAGTTVKFTAWYDNSDQNPANPDPAQTVGWGEQTFEEMLLGYVEYVVPGETPGEAKVTLGVRRRGPAGAQAGGRAGENLESLFQRLDRNGDGKVSREELPRAELFQRLDRNRDDFITFEEARAGQGGR